MPEPSSLTPLLSTRPSLRMVPRPPLLWRTGAIFIAAGIATGAFGTHALKSIPGYPPDRVDVFMTATHYAIFNGLGLCIISLHPRFSVHRFAGPAIAIGGFLFSATMMVVVLAQGFLSGLAPVIPLGGMITLAGYISLAM